MIDMNSAQIIDFPARGSHADATIRATVRGLMKGKSLNVETVAPRLGMNAATLYRKLATKRPVAFKAGEVAEIADVLNVSVADLYSGLGGTFDPPEPGAQVRHGGLEPPTQWFEVSPSHSDNENPYGDDHLADIIELDHYRHTKPEPVRRVA